MAVSVLDDSPKISAQVQQRLRELAGVEENSDETEIQISRCKTCLIPLTDENWYPSMRVRSILKCKTCQNNHARIRPKKPVEPIPLSNEIVVEIIGLVKQGFGQSAGGIVGMVRRELELIRQIDGCPPQLIERICDLASREDKTASVFLQDLLLSHGYFLSLEQENAFGRGGVTITLGKEHYAPNAMLS